MIERKGNVTIVRNNDIRIGGTAWIFESKGDKMKCPTCKQEAKLKTFEVEFRKSLFQYIEVSALNEKDAIEKASRQFNKKVGWIDYDTFDCNGVAEK